ncbi:MAG: serine protease [Candidatus Magasanikbacteria bacterium CG10_big_fil_rev_8_21_14_0_10_36_32]|uniref:Serine protease n=1 Tax=Candidatus Magasanikbacteria bacterium CG10_big_fil_rev_8_21_14_0_10_36_32 TaxID=1974646 RepID=A0A2M6W7A2_9BACT|nr:MAG: serine protease [Candidatus Magasanikbacteria bacterium CG10_big_fil_rev_8_21_14_0_10_36_32]
MNDILQLKGTLQERPHSGKPSSRNVPKNSPTINSDKLKSLVKQLQDLVTYWARQSIIRGCLIDVCYIDVIAKSNRISGLLSSSDPINDSIVGARFANEETKKHVITHHVSEEVIHDTIKKLEGCINLLDTIFDGKITHDLIGGLNDKNIQYETYGITKTNFRNIIVDSHYIEGFKVPNNSANTSDRSIITIYKTDVDLTNLMKEIGINVQPDKILSETTLLLYPNEIKLLSEKAPYLIAMSTEDISNLSFENVIKNTNSGSTIATIDPPKDEPIVGVIDTLFDESVYFSKWVDFRKMINEEIPTDPKDYVHGTSVSSIIVDGPTIDPGLDDGCGRFRVRHFGVAAQGQYSAFSIMKAIKEIVTSNPDIKVWNLSLGSDREINPNFISPEAAILDEIQYENNVIFVIAGTNKRDNESKVEKMIGSPADSINAVVVNSVDSKGSPATYSRKGLVLSFFNKPDVSSYGGDKNDYLKVCTPTGEGLCSGTSYATPWVTRKIAYLIEVLGLNREVAKALIIDAAAGWNNIGNNSELAPFVGHGIVPKNIENIIKADNDEIKFIVSGISEKWDTYAYNLPVPTYNNKHPFVAKATLCYFPSCSINQGVDYTNTELDIYFGRIKGKGIKSINKNHQSNDDGEKHYIYEGNAREFYRKWDNTKHIHEILTDKVQARDVYDKGMWGLSIKSKERLNKRNDGINFGLVVTLKEINGVNRINDFVHQCELLGWLVNRVDVDNKINIYNKAQEIITFDK